MAAPRINGISRERLHEVLSYDPNTGIFRRKVRPRRSHIQIGDKAGSIYPAGYRYINIDGVPYRAIRLAWLYVYGEPLPAEIDHKNTIKDDDRIENLRPVTTSQNQANRPPPRNNTSGIKGVQWQPSRQRWAAFITIRGKAKGLGRFFTREEAAEAYRRASVAAFGEYSRTHTE